MSALTDGAREVRILAQALPELGDLLGGRPVGNVVEYECNDGGIAYGVYLDRTQDYAIQRLTLGAGTVMSRYLLAEIEVLSVCMGELSVTLNDEDKVLRLGPSDTVTFHPGQARTLEAVTVCRCVGITVPAARGYPVAGRINDAG